MCTENRTEAGADPADVLDRLSAALGYPPGLFAGTVPVEPMLEQTAALLRTWSRLRGAEARARVLAFVAAVAAEEPCER